jgi:hypothetical protein
VITAGGSITMDHVSKFLSNDRELFNSVITGACRSIPSGVVLKEAVNQDLVHTLKRAIQECGIEALNTNGDSGLNKAYTMGYLHASFQDPDTYNTLYVFPTLLHQR